jgi:BA14K-like protein
MPHPLPVKMEIKMTHSVSQKGKWAKFATVALAATLSASVVAGSVAPAAANDFYYDDQSYDEQDFAAQSTRSIYRDEIGRYYIRHGRKQYIQYWDREVHRNPVVEPHRKRNRDKNLETAIIAGVAGLAVGAIIAGSQQQPREVYVQPKPRRVLPRTAFPDAPRSDGPRVITYEGAFEPWTQDWADWCANRYRSFNISSGTFTGYDGVKRFCVVN